MYFLAVCTSKVGCILIGETERRLLAPKNGYHRRICAIRLVKSTPGERLEVTFQNFLMLLRKSKNRKNLISDLKAFSNLVPET